MKKYLGVFEKTLICVFAEKYIALILDFLLSKYLSKCMFLLVQLFSRQNIFQKLDFLRNSHPVDTGHKLNVNKTLRSYVRSIYVLCLRGKFNVK